MAEELRFSVIMPIYNVEQYLNNSVNDILNQTYPNLQLILVDDCATDTSGEICDTLAKTDDRITVCHLEVNGGLSNARNQGLKRADGDYILFLDPDDRYEHTLLEEIKKSVAQYPAQIILFGLQEEYYDADGNLNYTKEIIPTSAIYNRDELRAQVMTLEKQTLLGYAWNKAYRLDFIQQNSLTFEKIVMIEDIVFNAEAFDAADSLNTIDKPLYRYAIRKRNSLTQKFISDYFELHEKRVKILLKLHRKWNIESKEELEALASIYCRYFLSALQRNCNVNAHMTHSDRKAWVKEQFHGKTYRYLRKNMHSDNKLMRLVTWGIRGKHVLFCLCMGRGIYCVKEKMPGIFSRLKQNR